MGNVCFPRGWAIACLPRVVMLVRMSLLFIIMSATAGQSEELVSSMGKS